MINYDKINEALKADIVSHLKHWLPDGSVDGTEYVSLNPTRVDHTLGSFRINLATGIWADFATNDRGGDMVSLYAYLFKNNSQHEAALDLAQQLELPIENSKKPDKNGLSKWEVVIPVPDGIEMPRPSHRGGQFVAAWKYYNASGQLLGAVARFSVAYTDKKTGEIKAGKDIIPYTYCRNVETGAMAWRNISFSKPRPLYGLEQLAQKPNANVIIVEGEKTADAARALFPAQAVLSWPGGGKAIKFVDIKPLFGRTVILWPDNDAPGLIAMHDLAIMLNGKCKKLRFVVNPVDAPEGWDLADAVWTPEQAKEYVKNNLADKIERPAVPVEETSFQDFTSANKAPPLVVAKDKEYIFPFRVLGYDRDKRYYMAKNSPVVTALTVAQHNKSHLMALAPLEFWEREFPDKVGCNWDQAVNAMLRACECKGIFNASLVRGRGAWHDDGKIAAHLGDRVLIDGNSFMPHQVKSRFIYEAKLQLGADLDSPLKNTEAIKFAELCEMLPWEKPISARLLAGWCVVAHIGGALTWRPHTG